MAKNKPAHILQTVFIGAAALYLCIAVAALANAGDLNVSWTHPTQNTDGTAIPATGAGAITGTRIEWGQCDGNSWGSTSGEVLVPYPSTTTVIPNVAPGTWCVRGYSRNSYGLESAASNFASKVIVAPTPNPPTLVTVESVAYEIKLHPVTQMASLGRQVGVIAYGVPCSEDALVETERGSYYPVPQENVLLVREPKSSVVVTRCDRV